MKTMRMSIPSWFPHKQIGKVVRYLGGNETTRIVGGTVRDILLDREGVDVDLATSLAPTEVQRLLAARSIKTIPTGIEHGTISAIYQPGQICEITTLRKDIDCYGRWASIEFTDRWDEDAARRDFTINAMFMDLDGNIYDYYDGLNDISRNVVRFVGNPVRRIEEDALRILRYFRMLANMGLECIDQPSMGAAITLAGNIATLSRERVRQEMCKLLVAPHACKVLQIMLDGGVGSYIGMTDIRPTDIADIQFGLDYLANLAATMLTTAAPEAAVEVISANWRLSNKEIKVLTQLCDRTSAKKYPLQHLHQPVNIHKRQIFASGLSFYLHYIKLLATSEKIPLAKIEELEKMAVSYQPVALPINGHDLIAVGIAKEGIGRALKVAKKIWMAHDFCISKQDLMRIILDKILD
ncbi:MAG: CCA tRNA nucleotidyltransferase [Proteobacteria bacterium]|nr:CCA tRNA nucleotidyltransferase [Pseudomonadota bacterium]